jgi:DNA polymerase-1
MSIEGLNVNKKGLAETNSYLEGRIKEKEQALFEACGRELNVNSSKQCQEYFYEHLGLGPYKNKDGGITTDDKAMSRIVRRAEMGSREAKLVQEVRHLKKLKSTYMEVELDDDSRLRCSWNPRGTWTGRLSSSKTIFGTGMNLQNLDPEFKSFVVAG